MDFLYGAGSNVFLIILIYIAVNLFLAHVASQWLGSYMPWLIVFPLLPGISHVVFFYLAFLKWQRQRALKVLQDITYTTDGLTPDGQLLVHVNKEKSSVTPFGAKENGDEGEEEDGEKEDAEEKEDVEEVKDKAVEYSVTPFGAAEEEVEEESEAEVVNELNQMRMEKIEELMADEKWADAYFLANLGLETARNEGDKKSVEIFEGYQEKIEENLPLTDSFPSSE